MGKLFGTDGIRGVANETLDAALAYRVGQAAAICLADADGRKPTVVIGKDTRISSDMLEGALIAGLTACGAGRCRCSYASCVTQRPLGVRVKNPICIRYGSYTSSSVTASSPIVAASVSSPTGPPP